MLAVIWLTLLFSVMGGTQSDGSHTGGAVVHASGRSYRNGWSITFSEDLITSEAGLCVAIPCAFTHHATFDPTSAIWFKCESKFFCEDADMIFHSEYATEAQVPFRGRVTLLEPNITQKNCSITINDLQESDTGSYQFLVEGQQIGRPSGFTFDLKKLITVTGLRQKPKVNVPPAVIEGQQTTLTCTAPGLCSGTPPNITWTWTKTGHHVPHIANNVTILTAENRASVSQRHSSTLTFTPSPEHDGSEVTCQVTFKGNITAAETVTLNVDLKMPSISGETTVEEGGTLNVTCDAESSSPSTVMWKLLDTKLVEDTQRATLVIPMVTGEHSGRYSCTAQHLNKTLTTFTDISVMTFPRILRGSECILQLETLTCTCISQGIPLPTITWPLLKNRSVYSVTITVLNSTINSTVYLTVEDHDNTSVQCFSTNYLKTVNKTLIIIKKDEVQNEGFFSILAVVKIIVVALMGVALSIYCLARIFHREKNPRDQAESVRMVICQDQHEEDKVR